jgi:hypothetical protein
MKFSLTSDIWNMADHRDWGDGMSPSEPSVADIERLEQLDEESTSRWVHGLSRNGYSQGPADDSSTMDIVNTDVARMPSRTEQRAFGAVDTGRMPSRISRIEHGDVGHQRAPSRILQKVDVDTGRMPSRIMRVEASDIDTRSASRVPQATKMRPGDSHKMNAQDADMELSTHKVQVTK